MLLSISVTMTAAACIFMLLHFKAAIHNLESRVKELERLQGEP